VLSAGAVAAIAVVVLVLVERRAAHPVLPPDLFGNRAVLMSLIIMFLGTGAVMMGAMNYLPVYLQLVQGKSASSSGLLLLPMLLPAIAVALLTGGWTTTARRFRPALIAGTALLALGCGLLATMTTGTAGWLTAGYMVLGGLGIGLLFQTPVVLVQNSAGPEEVGAATGVAMFLRTMGGAIGVGALGSLFTNTLADRIRAHGGPSAGTPDVSALTPEQAHHLPAALQQVVAEAVAAGSSVLFWVATAAAVVALLAAVCIPRNLRRER
jgi:MFS family permease